MSTKELKAKISAWRNEAEQELIHADKEVKRYTGVNDDAVRHYRSQHHFLSGRMLGYSDVLLELEGEN